MPLIALVANCARKRIFDETLAHSAYIDALKQAAIMPRVSVPEITR